MCGNSNEELLESLIKAAVIENSYRELNSYPSDEEINKLTISENCDRKIRRSVKKLRFKEKLSHTLKRTTRAAAVILILLIGSFTFLMQFEEVRAACYDAAEKIYEKYIEFYFNKGDDNQAELDLGYVPDGYYEVESIQKESLIYLTYKNDQGDSLTLRCVVKTRTTQIDNEHYDVIETEINGAEGKFFAAKDSKFENYLIWDKKDYRYTLKAKLAKEEMERIAKNIK